MEKILNRAASDPTWKQLLDDPETALREANVPEIQKMQEEGEVRGHTSDLAPGRHHCWCTYRWWSDEWYLK
jgi:hypothetical protein